MIHASGDGPGSFVAGRCPTKIPGNVSSFDVAVPPGTDEVSFALINFAIRSGRAEDAPRRARRRLFVVFEEVSPALMAARAAR